MSSETPRIMTPDEVTELKAYLERWRSITANQARLLIATVEALWEQEREGSLLRITNDDLRMMEHTVHRIEAAGGAPIYVSKLSDFVERMHRRLSTSQTGGGK